MQPYVTLDLVSAALAGVLVLSFLRVYRLSGEGRHALAAAGFALLGIGMAVVSTSVFDLTRVGDRFEGIRLAAHTSAALVIFLTYASASAALRPWAVSAGVAAAAAGVVGMAVYAFPPVGAIPRLQDVLIAAHAFQLACYGGTVLFILRGASVLTLDRLLVPGGFLAYAMSKYTWLMIDITGELALVPFVYVWRFLTLGLLLLALWGPKGTPPPVAAGSGFP